MTLNSKVDILSFLLLSIEEVVDGKRNYEGRFKSLVLYLNLVNNYQKLVSPNAKQEIPS